MVMNSMSMPPKTGRAMGLDSSDPLPEARSTGTRAISVVTVVITAGLILRLPALTTMLRSSAGVPGLFLVKFAEPA